MTSLENPMPQQSSNTASLEHNIECVRQFIDTIWNRRELNASGNFLGDDYLDHAYEPGNQQGLLAMVQELTAAFPDARQRIESITAQDDMVVCRMRLEATHDGAFRQTPASGKQIKVSLYRSFRLHEGRITEHWALLDTTSLLRQIGALPMGKNACKRD